MKTKFIKLSVIVVLSVALSACVVAPVQPVGYRMTSTSIITSTAMPTYVNGRYVGVQSGDYVMQAQAPTYVTPPSSTFVYVQNPVPTPTYTYSTYNRYVPYAPYYAPAYVSPWYGAGAGVGTGLGIGIGLNLSKGGWYRGGRSWGRVGHRGWYR